MPDFSHLHVHTQFSLLDGAASISSLYEKAIADGQNAIAITDHGNMFGVFNFVAEAAKRNPKTGNPLIKPIIGCEFYVVEDRHQKQFGGGKKDIRYHQLLLAKNETGYKNLIKLCSLGYMEGLYSKYPRIDKELILKYHEGLIATSCCLGAEVPKAIMQKSEADAEATFKWWLDLFGEDYYIEIQRHHIPEQEIVNAKLLEWSKKYNVHVIATNDSHYVDKEDANAHDILLCLNTGEKQSTPKNTDFGDDDISRKGSRFAFYNDEFYFKTRQEMANLFKDVPQALDNTQRIVDKVEHLNLFRQVLLPHFPIPPEFTDQDDYLRHLTLQGARRRYSDLTPEIEERINFELHTIKTMGFAGYFLIVSDFIQAGRNLGVFVGPGRGSAAGSVVAYCIEITNIDPIKYDLLFERFLNPDRKSLPDIDTDFDDEGRQKVIDYVTDKYGKNQVAQIVTYGTMAAKMSIKDVARVLDLPLADSNMLAKLVPDKAGISLKRVLTADVSSLEEKEQLSKDDINNALQLRKFMQGTDMKANVLKEALLLEGSVRNTGVHAAGVIIAPSELTEIIPVATVKGSDALVTQFDGSVIENAGVIKMDFLGLRNLSILKEAVKLIHQNKGVEIDLDLLPLDDELTFKLYQRGDTNGTFQFESAGMRKYLKELKPDKFGDLIAMNALYRPGPMEYIPSYIKRKHGVEPISYDLPELQEYLEETYGITVYQEQVMLLSQKLANFSKGDADTLRKAMGKKQIEILNKMKDKFLEGCKTNGLDLKKCEKIWLDWEKFAQYAFNKSHSTCYALVAYQTAYLKAHYPAEYMAALLSNVQSNLDKVSYYMKESRKMKLEIGVPDINESNIRFTVNKKGKIRFALSAIKGVGESAVQAILDEREAGGPFKNIFDLCSRVNLRTVNKRSLENLALAGAFDCFELSRRTYLEPEPKSGLNLIENALKFGGQLQNQDANLQNSLFGDVSEIAIPEPEINAWEEWDKFEKLNKEKEVIGIFLSSHPLVEYERDLEAYTNCQIKDLEHTKLRQIKVAGIITSTFSRFDKNGDMYCRFVVEDFSGAHEFTVFKKDYLTFKNFVEANGSMVYMNIQRDPHRFRAGEFEMNIMNMSLLSELRENITSGLKIVIDVKLLDEHTGKRLHELLEKHRGTKEVKICLADENLAYKVDFKTSKYKIKPDNELIDQINETNGVQCFLV